MTTVAFDIDGTLSTEGAVELFKDIEKLEAVDVGIVTANPPVIAYDFADHNDLDPDFIKSAIMKARPFLGIRLSRSYEGPYLYVGDRFSDYTYSLISGWRYEDSSNLDVVVEFLETTHQPL